MNTENDTTVITSMEITEMSGQTAVSNADGLSSLLFKFVRNRIPTRLANKISEAQEYNGTEFFDERNSNTAMTNSYRRYSVSTDDVYRVPETPPPRYRSKTSLHMASTSASISSESESEAGSGAENLLRIRNLNTSGQSTRLQTRKKTLSFTAEMRTGVRVGFANQGLNLLSQSVSEAEQIVSDATEAESGSSGPLLSRHLYVHGAQFILRGLPEQLANEEAVSVWSALPKQVRHVAVLEAMAENASKSQVPGNETSNGKELQVRRGSNQSEEISGLHQLVATLTLHILLFIQFLVPYLKYLFSAAWEIERKHQVTERLFASGMWSVDQAMRLSDNVCRMNDGKVGRAIGDAIIWWVEGITGGIQQGVGDGMIQMGLRR